MTVYFQVSLRRSRENDNRAISTIVEKSLEGLGKFWRIGVDKHLGVYYSIDQLMKLADEIDRADSNALTNLTKSANAIKEQKRKVEEFKKGEEELSSKGGGVELLVPELLMETKDNNDVKFENFFQRWTWTEDGYQRINVDEMFRTLCEQIDRAEKDFRRESSLMQDAYIKIQNLSRNKDGNLSVRAIDEDVYNKMDLIECEKDITTHTSLQRGLFVETKNITTLLIVVSMSTLGDFKKNCYRYYVIPDSYQEVIRESGWVLCAVSLLRNHVDDYKTLCKGEGWVIREFVYSREGIDSRNKSIIEAKEGYKNQCNSYTEFLRNNYLDTAVTWMRVRALRIFVESILEYGHNTDFEAFLISSTSQKLIDKIHQNLEAEFGDPSKRKDEDVAADKEYHSYIHFAANIKQLLD